jgi:predicted translation initiation factor SUI1
MGQRQKKTVLFLCTEHDSRNRFSEILFEAVAARMGLSWQASSKSLAGKRSAHIGLMAKTAIAVLEGMNIHAADAMSLLPGPATTEDLEKADLIVALNKAEHLPLLQERFSAWMFKVEFWQVDDSAEAPVSIEREIMGLVARILGGGDRPDSVGSRPSSTSTDKSAATPARKVGNVRVGRETAGRRGKGVTTVFDLPLGESGLRELAAMLKQSCGTGGTVKDGRIEIQGDQRERIIALLEKQGYTVKRAGG